MDYPHVVSKANVSRTMAARSLEAMPTLPTADLSRARALLGLEPNPTDQRITEAYQAYHAKQILRCNGKRESPAAAISIAIAAVRMLRYELAERASPARPPTGGGGRVQTRSEARHEEDEVAADADEDAEDDAGNSETEAEVRPPTGGGVPKPKSKKRKPKAGSVRRKKVAARQAPEKKNAGYVDRGRRVFRDNQGALATGTKRTCLADALWMALEEAGCEVDLEDVRVSIIPENPDANTPFAAAQHYAATNGFTLACVSKEMQKEKGGYEYNLLLRETGLFLVQLRVTTGKDDPNPPDLHVVLYDGKTVRDNNKYTKVKKPNPNPLTLTPNPNPQP